MSDPTKLQQIAQALKEADIDQGHASREQAEMQWGRYEMLARTAVEGLREPTETMLERGLMAGTNLTTGQPSARLAARSAGERMADQWKAMLKSILEGKS